MAGSVTPRPASDDLLRVAVAAFLSRYKGLSRAHTCSDLQVSVGAASVGLIRSPCGAPMWRPPHARHTPGAALVWWWSVTLASVESQKVRSDGHGIWTSRASASPRCW